MFPRARPQISRPCGARSLEGWTQCAGCKATIPQDTYLAAYRVCSCCGYHGRLSIQERVALLFDPGSFQLLCEPAAFLNPLDFHDQESYADRWSAAQRKGRTDEALVWGEGQLEGQRVAAALMDFSFMGGSMGSIVGQRLVDCCDWALHHRIPLLVVCASGGARMQEGLFSLLQMAKTAQALESLHRKGIPIFSLLTDPTCGGVTASFATLADLILAEPGALICFTGPRVIEQNLRQRLPPGAQRAEFLLAHGMVDQIVPRARQRATLAEFCRTLRPVAVGEVWSPEGPSST